MLLLTHTTGSGLYVCAEDLDAVSPGPLLTCYKLKTLELGVSMVLLGKGLLCKNVCSPGLAFLA